MGKSLEDIARELTTGKQQTQLIYAFNGVGKTRLSRAFTDLIRSQQEERKKEEGKEEPNIKVLYYNAFTEDLFYWDNDLVEDTDRILKIHPNNFTNWVLEEEGQEHNITALFQHYSSDKLTPRFNEDYSEVRFSIEGGNTERIENIKISRGEESCFVWCVFYSLLLQITEVLQTADPENRTTHRFDELEYIFIDDPVSSLDENHLIELAVNIATLIKQNLGGLKFIITTHNPLFYNVLYNELSSKTGYLLKKHDDGTWELGEKKGDSNKCFSYHLFLIQTIKEAIQTNRIQRYHFTLLRNLYEKTASFLGYPTWGELLPKESRGAYYKRIINFTSHSTLSTETIAEPTPAEQNTVKYLLDHLMQENKFYTGNEPKTESNK